MDTLYVAILSILNVLPEKKDWRPATRSATERRGAMSTTGYRRLLEVVG